MYSTSLRKVGGSVMLAVPPAILELLHLSAGLCVDITVDQGKLVVEPKLRPRYSLEELLAQCDASAQITGEEQEWFDNTSAGSELI